MLPYYARLGTCILTVNELGVYWDRKLGVETNINLLNRYKYEEVRKISYKSKARLKQIQILAKSSYFAIEIAPGGSFVDQEKTLEWFNFMKEKGVESFDAPEYMQGPIQQYRIIYE